MIEVPFVGPAYTLKSVNVASQSLINMFVDIVQDSNGKVQYFLKRTPGLNLKFTLNGAQSVRALYTSSVGRFFGVCGATVNEIFADNTVATIGTINTGLQSANSTTIKMTNNTTELIIVDGQDGWLFNFASGDFTKITDSAFPNGTTHVDFIDGYFVCNIPNTDGFAWSALDDGSSWSSLDRGNAEGSPDELKALIVSGRRIWLMGSLGYEVFYNTGDSSSTFLRLEGTYNDVGISAAYSLAKMDDILFWLGSNTQGHGQVWRSEGFKPRKVSTNAIDEAIQSYSTISDAIGFCYQKDGNNFYQLSFPTAQKTWVYDSSTNLWHERSYRDTMSGDALSHRVQNHALFNEVNYVGDRENGKVYQYDSDTFTDNGDTILLERTTPHYWGNLDRIFFSRFQIDMETGVGLSTGQGSDPVCQIENSNDGGHTFGTGQERTIGKQGEYKHRVFWTRQGASRDRVVRWTCSEPVDITILNAHVE